MIKTLTICLINYKKPANDQYYLKIYQLFVKNTNYINIFEYF